MTKLGTAMPQVAMKMTTLSAHLPRLNAAMLPSGMPTQTAVRIESPPRRADTGNLVAMICATVRPRCLTLSPRSPLTRPSI